MTGEKPTRIVLHFYLDPQHQTESHVSFPIGAPGEFNPEEIKEKIAELIFLVFDAKAGCSIETHGDTYLIQCEDGEFIIDVEEQEGEE